jgi:hypothetical protein
MMAEQLTAQDALVSDRWLRLAGAAGLLFLATFIVQFVMGPQAPEYNASTSDIVSFYTQHQTGIAVTTWLVGIFGVLYGVFLAGVWGALRRSNALWLATLGLVAGVSNTIMLFVGNAINVAIASYLTGTRDADPRVIAPLFNTASLLTHLLSAWMDGLAILALSGAMFLSGILAGRMRWTAWIGLLAGALFLVGGLAILDPTGPMQLATLLGVVPWFVWLAGISVRLVRGVHERAATPRTAARAVAAT